MTQFKYDKVDAEFQKISPSSLDLTPSSLEADGRVSPPVLEATQNEPMLQGVILGPSIMKESHVKFLWPIIGFIVPVIVFAVASAYYGSFDAAISVLLKGDELIVTPSSLQLEAVIPDSDREVQLVLHNFGSKSFMVVEGRTSCRCLKMPLTGLEIPAGQQVVVVGSFRSPRTPDGILPLKIWIWLDKSDRLIQVPVSVSFVKAI